MSLKAAQALRVAILIGFAPATLSACSQQAAESDQPVQTATLPATEDQRISEIQLALSERNYGSAAQLARSAQADFPQSSNVHLLAAQAESRLGNAGNAAAAFQRAIDAGLHEPQAALLNNAFDNVRGTAAFLRFRATVDRSSVSEPREPGPARTPERVRAGDVEIISDGSGDYIRAGDVVLDTRN